MSLPTSLPAAVFGLPATASRIRALAHVDYVGPYHPAFRIHPDLLASSGLLQVKIITFTPDYVNPVLAFLDHQGVPNRGAGPTEAGVISFAEGDGFGVVRARVPAALLPAIARLRAVEYIEPIYEMRLANADTQWVHQSNQSGVRTEWGVGLDGSGQIIGIADTGLDFDNEQFRQNNSAAQGDLDIQLGGISGPYSIYNETNYNRRKLIRYQPMSVVTDGLLWYGPGGNIHAGKDSPGDGCTFGHGTAVASTAAGNDDPITFMTGSADDGVAKGAKIYMQDIGAPAPGCPTGTDSLSYIPDDYADLYQPAYDAGVRIHSNSYGSDNSDYDLEAHMIDKFVWSNKDFLVVFSASAWSKVDSAFSIRVRTSPIPRIREAIRSG